VIAKCQDCKRQSISSQVTCPVCGGAMEQLCENCNERVRLPDSLLCGDCEETKLVVELGALCVEALNPCSSMLPRTV
jgi:hypothetical protein